MTEQVTQETPHTNGESVETWTDEQLLSQLGRYEENRITLSKFSPEHLRTIYGNYLPDEFTDVVTELHKRHPGGIKGIITPFESSEPSFKSWAEGAYYREGDGLRRFYHGTKKDFSQFEFGEIGFHLGDAVTATHVVSRGIGIAETEGARIIPVVTNVKNPLILDKDLGYWGLKLFGDHLQKVNSEDPKLSQMGEELTEKAKEFDELSVKEERRIAPKEAATILGKYGYDSIQYPNNLEAQGSYSLIVFNADNIKSIYSKNFTKGKSDLIETND